MTYPASVKEKSTLLRQKGCSINEIASKMKIAKSTAFVWLKDIKQTNKINNLLIRKKQKRYFQINNIMWMKAKWAKPRFWTIEKLNILKRDYHSGLSMLEVARKMNVSLASINHIMRRKSIERRLPSETLRHQFYNSPLSFNPKQNLTTREEMLKTAGLMLYWGEGFKKNAQSVSFANSDPLMVRIFVKFLRTIYRVDESRLRYLIYCYTNHKIEELTTFWSSLTQIPKSQFQKPYIRRNGGNKHNKMKYGVVHVVYSDTRLIQLILKEIKQLSYNM